MPEYLVEDLSTHSLPDSVEMRQVATRLPVAKSLREIQTFAGLPPRRSHDHGIELHKWDYWNGIDCCLCREFDAMSECFQALISGQNPEGILDTVRITREKVDKLNLHDVSYVFRCMHDAFEPVNVREGHPHVRGLMNFLISMFRASTLLVVLEYLLLGEVEQHRRRIFQEFYRAEHNIVIYDPTVWGLRKTELLSSMGLLLGPIFHTQEPEELLEDRRWLSEIWSEHHESESENFNRCRNCPCRSLGRVQRLWQSEMTSRDYVLFLSQNPWIWIVEPGWAMEPKLTKSPDLFEQLQLQPCASCGAK